MVRRDPHQVRVIAAAALALALAFSLACSAPPPAPAALGSGPLDVSVTLEEAARAGAEIGPEGGTLSAAARDGTRFTLEIPRGALAQTTRITMTPVAAIQPFPFSKGLIGAVQLEPDGLELAVPALLTIAPNAPVSLEERQGFSYYGSGKDFHMYPLLRDPARLRLKLIHFSGGGVGKATDADRSQQARRTPQSPEAQMWQRVAEAVARERARQITGTASDEMTVEDQQLQGELSEAVKSAVARAVAECDAQTLLGLERQAQLLGVSWVSDAQAKEFDEKCNRLSLSFDSTITDEKSSSPAWRHEARAVVKDVLVRSDGRGDLVGTATVDVTFAASGFPCTDAQRSQVPMTIRIVGGTASPSPTLVLSFDWIYYGQAEGPLHLFAECGDYPYNDPRTPMPDGTGPEMWRASLFDLHEDEAVESQDAFGESLRVTGWTIVGDGPARSWRKSYVRTTEGRTGFGDQVVTEERTTIELRRTSAK